MCERGDNDLGKIAVQYENEEVIVKIINNIESIVRISLSKGESKSVKQNIRILGWIGKKSSMNSLERPTTLVAYSLEEIRKRSDHLEETELLIYLLSTISWLNKHVTLNYFTDASKICNYSLLFIGCKSVEIGNKQLTNLIIDALIDIKMINEILISRTLKNFEQDIELSIKPYFLELLNQYKNYMNNL